MSRCSPQMADAVHRLPRGRLEVMVFIGTGRTARTNVYRLSIKLDPDHVSGGHAASVIAASLDHARPEDKSPFNA